MKSEKFNNWLLGALIVLVAVSVYNVNTVLKGITESYFTGLFIVLLLSLAASSLFISFVGKTKTKA